jgi:putative ABC transport system substrate-binding protein
MDRRTFVGAVAGGFVVARSLAAPPPSVAKVYRVGFLLGASAESVAPLRRALTEGLRNLGFVEGRNIIVESRYADGRTEQLPGLAAELVRLRVDVIVTGSNVHVVAAQRATTTIPIVTINSVDPVGAGLVASLTRPGGNVTGLSGDASHEIWSKNLALLKEVAPRLAQVGVLGSVQSQGGVAALQAAARQLNVALEVADIRDPEDFDSAFTALVGKRVDAIFVPSGPLTYARRQQIADLALKHRLPAIHTLSEFAQAGLLMSHGPNLRDLYRRAASYVARILEGANAGDLPIEQPTKFELVINLKTAKALGITVPQSVLLRADEVIL